MATPALTSVQEYEFDGGFPTPDTIRRAYDEADLVRAITAYRFFYPSVSAMCVYRGNVDSGMIANRVFCADTRTLACLPAELDRQTRVWRCGTDVVDRVETSFLSAGKAVQR